MRTWTTTVTLASYVLLCLEEYSRSPPSQYGNIDEQLVVVAEQLGSIPELQDGFDGIGFSQGTSVTVFPKTIAELAVLSIFHM